MFLTKQHSHLLRYWHSRWRVSNAVDDCLQGQIAHKSSNRKLKIVLSRLVTAWLASIAFHLRRIGMQTLLAIDSNSRQTSFPSFCEPPSDVAVLFDTNLSRRLLCTWFDSEHAVLFLCHILTQRSMTNRKDWAKRWARPWSATTSRQFHQKFHFTWKKKCLSH